MIDEIKTRNAIISAAREFLTQGTSMNTRFGLIENLPTIEESSISYENKNFDTDNKPVWCSIFYVPNQPFSTTVGGCGVDEINGFLQIDFNIPPDTGESVLMDWEQKARLFFHHGRGLVLDGHSVLVTSSGMSQGSHVENNYRKSLTVAFRSRVRRNNQTI